MHCDSVLSLDQISSFFKEIHVILLMCRLGSMVAVFKYSTFINYSVSLPPPILEFSSSTKGEFCRKDFEDVCAFMKLYTLFTY